MVKTKKISIEEAKSIKRTVKPSEKVLEYIKILEELEPGEALEIDAKTEKEKPASIKNRIFRIKKSMNMTDIEVRRVGDKVMFWKEK